MRVMLILVVLVILALAIVIFTPVESRIDRRAWLTTSAFALRNADMELHKFGSFTNHFPLSDVRVFTYTNRFTIDGIDYRCELAAECERLTNRGFLTMTTNQIFVWVDKKGGLTALTESPLRPPGF